jgi:coproporphyrinogen III oxidase-like Fe-S oxidoreductase
MTPEHLEALRDAGFNRASIGVQDFEPKVQEAVHQVSDLEAEVSRLRAENARLKMEREILRKAAAYFAKDAL